jgi:hypothetical protein
VSRVSMRITRPDPAPRDIPKSERACEEDLDFAIAKPMFGSVHLLLLR